MFKSVILFFILSTHLLVSSEFKYPSKELVEHIKTHGNLKNILNKLQQNDSKALELFIQRSILTLDHIEDKGPKFSMYLSSYQKDAMTILENNLKTETDSIRKAIFRSLLHRLKRYINPPKPKFVKNVDIISDFHRSQTNGGTSVADRPSLVDIDRINGNDNILLQNETLEQFQKQFKDRSPSVMEGN